MGYFGCLQPPQVFFALEVCQSPNVTVKLISVSPKSDVFQALVTFGIYGHIGNVLIFLKE